MSLAKLRLSPLYARLAKFEASAEGHLSLGQLADGDLKAARQICQHLDLKVEAKGGEVTVRKPGHEFFEALDVAAPKAGDAGGLSAYVARGDLAGAEKLARRGEVSQTNLFTALLALPQGACVEQACKLLETAAATAPWPSEAARRYFERRARQALRLFLGEARERLDQADSKDYDALARSGRCLLDVMLSDGRVKGEIMVGSGSGGSYRCGRDGADPVAGSVGRGLLAGDCAAIRPMDGGHMTECEVVVASPLILRPMVAPPPGTTGSGRSFRVDGLANRQQFARALAALHLCAAPATKWGNATKDRGKWHGLAGQHRPGGAVLEVLLGQAPRAPRCSGKALSPGELQNGLNASQREALATASARSFCLVQGPPGTGKTTVAVRILRMWATGRGAAGGVLCASDSNIAVDNMVEGLARAGAVVVRVGRPEAARPEVLEHCAEEIAARRLGLASAKEANMDSAARGRLKSAVQQVIAEAEVVCATAVGAGGGALQDRRFARVLVDEAAQALELVTLVPICRGAEQVVLCGDQCQLPPTIGTDAARGEGLEVSLFERLAAAHFDPLVLLRAQHRMHPAIAAFPSAAFYGGRLLDGLAAGERPPLQGVRWPRDRVPVCFFQTRGSEQREGDSFKNEAEAERVLDVVQDLIKGGLEPSQVGIVTPYAAQVRLLRVGLARRGLPAARDRGGVETNSVDGYQGREKEAIVISTVRCSAAGGLGFVADWRRANVALTRARRGVVVIGDAATLSREPTTWAPWLRWVRRAGLCSPRGCLDSLAAGRSELRAVGLLAAEQGDGDAAAGAVLEALERSAEAWAADEEAAAELRRYRSPSAGQQGSGGGGKGDGLSKKDKKKLKKAEKKAKKKAKKEAKKRKAEAQDPERKKAKKPKKSSSSSSSSSSS